MYDSRLSNHEWAMVEASCSDWKLGYLRTNSKHRPSKTGAPYSTLTYWCLPWNAKYVFHLHWKRLRFTPPIAFVILLLLLVCLGKQFSWTNYSSECIHAAKVSLITWVGRPKAWELVIITIATERPSKLLYRYIKTHFLVGNCRSISGWLWQSDISNICYMYLDLCRAVYRWKGPARCISQCCSIKAFDWQPRLLRKSTR